MALKIRLRKQGRTNRPFYRLVVTDSRNKRDGKYVESIGWYNPFEEEAEKNLSVNGERAEHWLGQGAEITPKAEALVARAAPEVIKQRTARLVARQAAEGKKRKARRKKAKAAA